MLDHLIVTIYGYALSIHRLIQLIDHCFLGDCGSAWDGLQMGEFSIDDHCMVLIMVTVIRGYWVSGYTGN